MNDQPKHDGRRSHIEKWTPLETEIKQTIRHIEACTADVRLTRAQWHLEMAFNYVADIHDDMKINREPDRPIYAIPDKAWTMAPFVQPDEEQQDPFKGSTGILVIENESDVFDDGIIKLQVWSSGLEMQMDLPRGRIDEIVRQFFGLPDDWKISQGSFSFTVKGNLE